VLQQIPDELKRTASWRSGYSLGGAMLLKYLGEEGSFTPLRARLDLRPRSTPAHRHHMLRPRNVLYHSYILNALKTETLAEERLSDEEREVVRSARSVFDYDDRSSHGAYGFRGAEDYYSLCSPRHFMPRSACRPWCCGVRRPRIPSSTIATSNGPTISGCCR